MERMVRLGTIVALLAVATLALADPPPAPFSNGFEVDTHGWFGDVTRVASGATGFGYGDGILSAHGSYHASVTPGGTWDRTDWGGYAALFPDGGYVTGVAIYLDTGFASAQGNSDTRFDWTSAVNSTGVQPPREFVFNAGTFWRATDDYGFVISAGTTGGRKKSNPADPAHDPVEVTAGGWYRFGHHFYDVAGGRLACDMGIWDMSGNQLGAWTLSDAADIIGVSVTGNRYGWFPYNEFPNLMIDDSYRGAPPVEPPDETPEPAAWVLLSVTGVAAILRGRRRR